jgi:hypothetical protein
VRARWLFLALITCSAVMAPAQESSRLLPRKLLLLVSPAQGSGFAPADVLIITRSLDQRIQEADPALIIVESAADSVPGSDEEMRTLAREDGADCWMSVSIQGDWSSARLKVRAFDLVSGAAVSDLAVARTAWGSPGALAQETWADVVPAVAGKFPMVLSAETTDAGPVLARLTVQALPGSVITGLGTPPLKVGPDGSAERMLAPYHEYALRVSLPGYRPVTERIFLSEDRVLALKQEAPSRRGLELSLTDARAPGIDMTIQADQTFFIRFGLTTYAVGLALSQTEVLLSDPLTILTLQAGLYLSPEDQFFRTYLGVGGFLRVVHAAGWAPMLDPVAPLGLRFVAGLEVPVSARGRVYLEYTPTLYYTSVPDAFRAALGPDDTPGWWFGPRYGVSIFSFRLGYRWSL